MPTPITLHPAAKGYRRSLCAGRAVSVYYDRHPPNEWGEHTREQQQLSVFFEDAECLVKWKTPDGERREFRIQGPTVWLIPPGTPHSLVCPAEADMVTLFLEREFAAEIATGEAAEVTVVALAQLTGRDTLIGQLAKPFRRLCRDKGPANAHYVESIGTLWGTHLLRALLASASGPHRQGWLPDEALLRVTRFIDDHLGDNLHLVALGRAAGFSSSHFGRLFKERLGMTPHHYVMHRRVAKAEELLLCTGMKEIEIAALCGFSDDTLMARWFRRVIDCLPSEVRSQSRQRT